MRERRSLQGGFTLVELLVVVAIIAVLAAAAVPRLIAYVDKTRYIRAMNDVKAMRDAIEAFAAANGKYPSPAGNLHPNVYDVLQASGIKFTGDSNGIRDPWGNPYWYEAPAVYDPSTGDLNYPWVDRYTIGTAGPDKRWYTADDVWCTSEHPTVEHGPLQPGAHGGACSPSAR